MTIMWRYTLISLTLKESFSLNNLFMRMGKVHSTTCTYYLCKKILNLKIICNPTGCTISDSDEDLTDILAVPSSAAKSGNETTVNRSSTDLEIELDQNNKSLGNATERNSNFLNDENLLNKNGKQKQ